MLDVLANRTYHHLFFVQVIALVGTGLATVTLGLLAFDLAGADADAVFGTALAIKMVTYTDVASIVSAFADRVPRRTLLVALDLVRAAVALVLPFITEIWQVYVLIFVLQSTFAGFTSTFQATIPDVLPKEADYTKALSLPRLAYDLENLASPVLATALLTVVSFHSLFLGTVVDFVTSAVLVVSTALPKAKQPSRRSIYERTTRGSRIYLSTPRLRGLLALSLAVASASAMVIVNTVALVQSQLQLNQHFTAGALAAFDGGSMLIVLGLPELLERLPDRRVMVSGASVLTIGLLLGPLVTGNYAALVVLRLLSDMGYSLAQTPSGRLLRHSANEQDRPVLSAAQFTLLHACWFITYPVVGWLGAKTGLNASFIALDTLTGVTTFAGLRLWPKDDPVEVPHTHGDLREGDEHLQSPVVDDARQHSYAYMIDDQHQRWPRN